MRGGIGIFNACLFTISSDNVTSRSLASSFGVFVLLGRPVKKLVIRLPHTITLISHSIAIRLYKGHSTIGVIIAKTIVIFEPAITVGVY
jgi:uncharacterized RDD family membrane protein YckC